MSAMKRSKNKKAQRETERRRRLIMVYPPSARLHMVGYYNAHGWPK